MTEPPVPGVFPGRCLVLVPDGAAAPEALLKALGSRELSPGVVHDEPAVMAALAETGGGRRVLVVVEPGRWGRLAELVNAVKTYHAGTLCWQYIECVGQGVRLTMLDPAVVNGAGHGMNGAGQDGAGRSGAGVAEQPMPAGQIVPRRRRPIDDLLVKVPGRQMSTREIVTQQELTMLLGPAPGEAG